MSLTKVSYSMISGATVNVLDYGAGSGNADVSTQIQNAINAVNGAGGGTVYIPVGTYKVQNTITLLSNVIIRGEGKASNLIVNSATAFDVFSKTSGTLQNAAVIGIGFDGLLNYPADSKVYKQTYSLLNAGIITISSVIDNFTIENCYFNNMSEASIDINGDSNKNIFIRNNYLYKGSYVAQALRVRSATTSPTEAQRPLNIIIEGNTVDTCGPQYYWDASKEDWTASADGIQVKGVKNALISGNTVNNTAAEGIRIERSINVAVTNNNVYDAGQNGIICYVSFYVSITGNTVKSWGKIPFAYAIQSYSGSYVYAKEFPQTTGPTLPANPLVSSYFAIWPFDLTNVDIATIVAYSATNYHVGGSVGILPFRGNGAIIVTQESTTCNVTGNSCYGDTSTTGTGAYTYSSDFGYTLIHPTNSATTSQNGDLTQVVSNNFANTRVNGIYAPAYTDPIAQNGPSGLGTYVSNSEGSSTVSVHRGNAYVRAVIFPATFVDNSDPNSLDDYEEGDWTPTVTFGNLSVGITYATQTGKYVKVGKNITVMGVIVLTSKGSSVGVARVSGVPFAAETNSATSVPIANYTNIVGFSAGPCCRMDEGESRIVIAKSSSDSAPVSLSDTEFSNNSALKFSFSFRTV
jgi:parallel beta-helix repeat protein